MEITEFENDFPITIAIKTAFESGLIDQDKEEVLKKELEEMITESAKKFVNIKSIKSIKQALDIVLGILSLSIMRSSNGENNPQLWSEIISREGLKKTAGTIVPFVKEAANKIALGYVQEVGKKPESIEAREYLIKFATSKRNGRWCGFDEMTLRIKHADESIAMHEFTKWLISFLIKIPLEKWMAINEDRDHEGVYPQIDHAINNLLFRYCNKIPNTANLALTVEEFKTARTKFELNRKKWLEDTRKKYEEIVSLIPEKFRECLLFSTDTNSKRKKDWFERHLAKGPPSVPKNGYLDFSGKFQGYHI